MSKSIENWVSSAERGAESVATVVRLFSNKKLFPWITAIEETEKFSSEDRRGFDLIFTLDNIFAELTGLPVVRVQVKSSETGVDGFLAKGKKLNGYTGRQWYEDGLILLNGSWAQESIIADFIAQLINLIGIWGNEYEMKDFLGNIHPGVVSVFEGVMAKGLLEQSYRTEMIKWVERGWKYTHTDK